MNEKKLGDILREKRESLNLTVEELASTTKLKKSVILALENGDYGELQESVYIRGFFKIYASALGLDYKELYPQLEKELRAIGKIPEEEGKPGRKSPIFIVIIAIIIVVPVLYYIIFHSFPGIEKPGSNVEIAQPVTEPVAQPPVSEPEPIIKESEPAVEEPEPKIEETTTEEVVTPVKKEVAVEIKGLGYSWVRVIVDDKKVFEGFINSGDLYSWKGERSIVIRVGNAGAVNVVLNGKDIGVLGKSGEVVEREFIPE